MHFIFLSILFLLSGFSSLVFQTLWIRILSLGVGSTSASMSMVLGIFFSGLAAGSWIAGKYSHKLKSPLLSYGIIEACIGIYALILLPILFRFHEILSLFPIQHSFSLLNVMVKFGLVFLLLFLPTAGMGASLPFLIQIFSQSNQELGKKISLLYGINTLGAALGAFATGFLLIPSFGIEISNLIASVVTFFILFFCWLLKKSPIDLKASKKEKAMQSEAIPHIPFVLFATGFASLSAEVIWNKYLGIFLGSNIYGISLLLSLFLVGIALGSLALSKFYFYIKNLNRLFEILFFLTAASFLFSSLALNFLPLIQQAILNQFPSASPFSTKILLASLALFPPGALLGAIFPLAIRIHSTSPNNAAQNTGKLYAINTLGSILGSSATGLILLPFFGSAYSILIASLLLFFLSASLCWRQPTLRYLHLILLVGIVSLPKLSFENILRSAYPNQNFATTEQEEFQLIIEGKTGIISLSHDPQDGPNYKNFYRLKTNGLNESIYDRENLDLLPKYEALLGFLPMAFSRNPKSAFVVGYGGGYTVDFLTSSQLQYVFVAELEEGILKAADYVYQNKNPIRERKNLELQIEDARFLLASKRLQKFDIIVSQPSHSWLAGVANLFTKEFFQNVRDNLTPQGVYSQWLNLYNMNPEVLKSILSTFYDVFPHGYVFTSAGDQEMILIGSMNPIHFSLERLEAMAQNPTLSRQLTHIPVRSAYDVLAQYAASREEILKLSNGAKENTDRNVFAELTQSKLFYSEKNEFPARFLLENYTGNFSQLLEGKYSNDENFYRFLLSSLKNTSDASYKMLPIQTKIGSLTSSEEEKFKLALEMERFETAKEIYQKLSAKMNAKTFQLGLQLWLSRGDRTSALELWKSHPQFQATAKCYGIELSWLEKDFGKMKLYMEKLAPEKETAACGFYLQKAMGFVLLNEKRAKEAIPYLEAYYNNHSYDMENYSYLLASYEAAGDMENWKNFSSSYSAMKEKEEMRVKNLAKFYRAKGFNNDADFLENKKL
jgi:spermidine synthase